MIGAGHPDPLLTRRTVRLNFRLQPARSGWGRCCRKSPKLLCGKFPAERRNTRRLLVDMPTGQLPKSLVSSSHYDASPHTIVGSPHLRLGKFVFSNAKRLFRQHRPEGDIAERCPWSNRVTSLTS